MNMGDRIKAAREAAKTEKGKKMSRAYLAEKCSVIERTIYNWEKGDSSPDMDQLAIIAKVTGESFDYLRTGKRDSGPLEVELGALNAPAYRLMWHGQELSVGELERLKMAITLALEKGKNP
jgi:transcriptional regulator with XRE-family HTH domain